MPMTDGPIRACREDLEVLQEIADYLDKHRPENHPGAQEDEACPAVLIDNETNREIAIPSSLFMVVSEAVDVLLRGGAVAVMPYHTQLTTQQAADYLGVSRPHVVSLLEEGQIPFTRLRSHRRIRLEDLEDYRRRRDDRRRRALADLSRETFELGLYGLPNDAETPGEQSSD